MNNCYVTKKNDFNSGRTLLQEKGLPLGVRRLDHWERKDEHTPRMVQFFKWPGRDALQIFAGDSHSMVINEMGKILGQGRALYLIF